MWNLLLTHGVYCECEETGGELYACEKRSVSRVRRDKEDMSKTIHTFEPPSMQLLFAL